MVTPIVMLISAQTNAREREISAPCQIASKVDWPAPPVPRMVCRLKPHLSIAFAGLKCFAVESSRFAYASYPEKIG